MLRAILAMFRLRAKAKWEIGKDGKMITYEDMPQSAQKAYRLTNTVRKVLMILGWIVAGAFFVVGLGSMVIYKDVTFGELLFMCYITGGLVPGLVHCEFAFKSVFKSLLIFFIVGPWALAFILTFAIFAGGTFWIIDTIRFMMKKPLVYAWEHKYFLRTDAAQQEMAAEYQGAVLDALSGTRNVVNSSDTAKSDLQNLKEMLDQGLITQEEFDNKKKELLERI